MYKVIIKYFGELCDKETLEDEEVFDKEVICETDNLEVVKNEIENKIKIFIKDGYVLDLQHNEKTITMFFDYQENWNNYIEIYYVKNDIEQEKFINDLYYFGYIKTIQCEINKWLNDRQAELIDNGFEDNLILKMALVIELKNFLDNEVYEKNYSISKIEVMTEFKENFIEEVINSYLSRELGNSYVDIKVYIQDFLNNYRKE